MGNSVVRMPIEYFGDFNKGRPIFNGSVYIGEPDTDPEIESNRKDVELRQEDGTRITVSPSGQPLKTGAGGYFTYEGSAVEVLVSGSYSMKVLNSNDNQVYYFPNISEGSSVKSFATLDDAAADSGLVDGDVVIVGDRGAAVFDVVLASTVTPNTYNVVQCTGVPTLALNLRINETTTAKEWGAPINGVDDDSPAVQNYADYSKERDFTLRLPDGEYLFNTTIDLSSPGGGALGFRNLEVVCGNEAKFYGATNAVTLFNVGGQRRFKWSGGWFRRADVCFQGAEGASPQPSDAYASYDNVTFDGESTGAIKKCYSSTTPIGVYFTNVKFGTNQADDQIDLAVDMPGNDVGQSNLVKFTRCQFINNVNSVNMPTSSFARFGTEFNNCWFESGNGYAINAGNNTRDLVLNNCYFEACGSASVKPIIMDGGKLVFNGGQIIGNQNNTDAFIAASAGVEIETRGKIEYLATTTSTVFVDYASGIAQPQYLKGVNIQGTGTETYKSLLFSTASQADEQYIAYEVPRISSTLTDTQISEKYVGNLEWKGVISRETEIVNLTTQSVDVQIANVNIPNAGNGVRFSAESYQTIQGVGHAGQYNEWVAYWNGATWVFTGVTNATTAAGIVFTPVSVDTNNFRIDAKRTVGGGTNTPFRALVTVRQAANNMEGNEVQVT